MFLKHRTLLSPKILIWDNQAIRCVVRMSCRASVEYGVWGNRWNCIRVWRAEVIQEPGMTRQDLTREENRRTWGRWGGLCECDVWKSLWRGGRCAEDHLDWKASMRSQWQMWEEVSEFVSSHVASLRPSHLPWFIDSTTRGKGSWHPMARNEAERKIYTSDRIHVSGMGHDLLRIWQKLWWFSLLWLRLVNIPWRSTLPAMEDVLFQMQTSVRWDEEVPGQWQTCILTSVPLVFS